MDLRLLMHGSRKTLALLIASCAMGIGIAYPVACCAAGIRNMNPVTASRFRPSGTLLVLSVGDGSTALSTGLAMPLTLLEVNTASGSVVQRIPINSTGMNIGSNLACTLSTGTLANASWDYYHAEGFAAPRCTNQGPYYGQLTPALGGPQCDGQGTTPASLHWNASWNKLSTCPDEGGKGDGMYPLWHFDREGLMSLSYDGRFVTFPCYVHPAGSRLKYGSWMDGPPSYAFDSFTYDDKAIALVTWESIDGVDTVTHLPGTDFYYGPLIVDEPQYFTSAVTTGNGWPRNEYFAGGAADNGEGTMHIPNDDIHPSKGGNRISNSPGYFDYGTLGWGSVGNMPTPSSTGDAPLAFVTSPSVLNAGQEGTQHQLFRGLNVMTVGGVPGLSSGQSVTFVNLPGFQAYSGSPYGFVYDSSTSLWFADAGPNTTGGPVECSMLGGSCPASIPLGSWDPGVTPPGLWQKYSCTLQHWIQTSPGDVLAAMWMYERSIVVSADAPCYGLAGRQEGGQGFVLYTATAASVLAVGRTKIPSKLWKIVANTNSVTLLSSAPANTVYRSVSLPPQARTNYTCPPGQYGISCDLACSYGCCTPCKTQCQPGYTVMPTCSRDYDNTCVPDTVPTPSPAASPTPTPRASTSTSSAASVMSTPSTAAAPMLTTDKVTAPVVGSLAVIMAGACLAFFAMQRGYLPKRPGFWASGNVGALFSGSGKSSGPSLSLSAATAHSGAGSPKAHERVALLSKVKVAVAGGP